VLHILAAMTAVGGLIFLRVAALPALETLDAERRRTLHEALRARWAMWIHASVLFLLATGLANFILFLEAAKNWSTEWRETYYTAYQMLFGIKFLLALAIFALAEILVGRSAGTQKIRDNARVWVNLNLALAVAVVIISGTLRLTHVGPSEPPAARSAEPASGG
jgi:putative copper export protein